MKPLFFSFPESVPLGENLCENLGFDAGLFTLRRFPDGETYVRIEKSVKDRHAILLCTLSEPDNKILPLLFLAETLRDLGVAKIGLVSPYLAYLRQDRRFQEGEGISSRYFAKLLSEYFNWLVTIDPHLHRYHALEEIYTIPTQVLHATESISNWINKNLQKPLLIGPDSESEQWVAEIAKQVKCPYVVLEKIRRGDRDVEVKVPDFAKWKDCQPVLVDDIISTARTMIETIGHLKKFAWKPPVCIGVHAIFAGQAFAELRAAGAGEIITCNTISHESNGIDMVDVLATGIRQFS